MLAHAYRETWILIAALKASRQLNWLIRIQGVVVGQVLSDDGRQRSGRPSLPAAQPASCPDANVSAPGTPVHRHQQRVGRHPKGSCASRR